MRLLEYTRRKTAKISGEIVYCLAVDEIVDQQGYACGEDYGIKVYIQNGDELCIAHISTSVTRIMELLDLVSDGCVTPATLADVVYDFIE